MTTPPEPHAPFRVAEGSVRIYRLFDVADAVDLERAASLAQAPAARFRLESPRGSPALQFDRPPLHLGLGRRTLPLAGGPREATASLHLFEYGVASVMYELPVAPGTALDDLVPLAEELTAAATPAIDAAARAEAEALCGALAAALERPHAWEGAETYTVFFVRRFDRAATAREILAGAPLARLLLGEPGDRRIAPQEIEDVLKHHFSYYEDDLAVVDWNSAFVLEPTGADDIPDLLEFATAHLLELRYYDALLDRELHGIYDEMEAGSGARGIFTRRHARLQRRTAALLLELSEMVERLENGVKIVGDFYLARLYQAAVARFRLPAWQGDVLRKQRLLAEVHGLLNDAADVRRAELLEITVILLISWEIVWAFIRH